MQAQDNRFHLEAWVNVSSLATPRRHRRPSLSDTKAETPVTGFGVDLPGLKAQDNARAVLVPLLRSPLLHRWNIQLGHSSKHESVEMWHGEPCIAVRRGIEKSHIYQFRSRRG